MCSCRVSRVFTRETGLPGGPGGSRDAGGVSEAVHTGGAFFTCGGEELVKVADRALVVSDDDIIVSVTTHPCGRSLLGSLALPARRDARARRRRSSVRRWRSPGVRGAPAGPGNRETPSDPADPAETDPEHRGPPSDPCLPGSPEIRADRRRHRRPRIPGRPEVRIDLKRDETGTNQNQSELIHVFHI